MNLKSEYSAIVIGAGPAGSSAAYALAKNGVDVLLVEKQREVGKDIFCAEGISGNTLNLVKKTFDIEEPQKFIATRVNSVRIISPELDYFDVYREDMGVILERKIFDRTLAEKAVSKGAHLAVSTKFLDARRVGDKIEVDLMRSGKRESVRTAILIGADGPASAVATSMGLNMDVGNENIHKCAQFLIYDGKIESNRMDFLFSKKYSPSGYAWTFPKGKGLANFGVGILSDKKEDPMEYLEQLLRDFYPDARVIGWLKGVVPTGGNLKKIYADNLIVAGDAARLADPLTGGGIAAAIISGHLAGETAIEALEAGDFSEKFLKKYEKRVWQELGVDYKISLIIREYLKNYTDERIIKLYRVLKHLFGGKNLQSIKLTDLFISSLKNSKELVGLLLGSGGDAIFNSLRKIIFTGK